ncbi:MAG: hypothetical protein M1816_006411 [Peltula sp. TS41687]|nr:MAG: hypothetical protein M1816_006411 [Peltula sp. TS41687]
MLPPPGFGGLLGASDGSNDVLSSVPSDLTAMTASITSKLATKAMTRIGSGGSMDTILAATATILANVATVTRAPAAGSTHAPKKDEGGSGECELLGPFSLLIQGALGLLAFSSLVFKRYRERPRRPIKVWMFDVSKQVVGSSLIHVANLVMSMLSAGKLSVKLEAVVESAEEEYRPNPCSFYLLNLGIDTTLGIPILIITLRVLARAFTLTPFGQPPESIESGNYGHPPKTTWWAKQSLIYFLGLLTMKTCVLFIFSVLPWISRVGDWALKWTEGDETVQVVFVMLLFPVMMNALQYYIIDSFIKSRKSLELESSSSGVDEDDDQSQEGGDHGGFYRGNRRSEDRLSFIPEEPEESLIKDMEGGGESGSETALTGDRRRLSRKTSSKNVVEEYDPAIDGEDRRPGRRGADDLREEPLLFPIEAETKEMQLAGEPRSEGNDTEPKRAPQVPRQS